MSALTVSGFISNPTSPNNASAFGYDNGGFFGPVGANLGGLPFTVTWTGIDCNCYSGAITGATITVSGVTLDLNAYNNISMSEWLTNRIVQMETRIPHEQSPPFLSILPSSQYVLSTSFFGDGLLQLLDSNHQFSTNAHLTIIDPNLSVPGPIAGTGISALVITMLLVKFVRRFRCH